MSLQRSEQNGRNVFSALKTAGFLQIGQGTVRTSEELATAA